MLVYSLFMRGLGARIGIRDSPSLTFYTNFSQKPVNAYLAKLHQKA